MVQQRLLLLRTSEAQKDRRKDGRGAVHQLASHRVEGFQEAVAKLGVDSKCR